MQPPSTDDAMSEAEALRVLTEMVIAMFATGSENSVSFGALKKVAEAQSVRLCGSS